MSTLESVSVPESEQATSCRGDEKPAGKTSVPGLSAPALDRTE